MLADQSWFIPGKGNAELVVELDTTGIPAPKKRKKSGDDDDALVQIEIEARSPISTRAQLDAFVATITNPITFPPPDPTTGGTVIIDNRSIVDSVRVDLRDTTFRDGRVSLRLIVEPVDDDDDELAMPQQGIHPIVIRVLRGDDVVAQIPTFVERLAWGTSEPPVVGVTDLAVMGRVDARPTLRPSGVTVNDPVVVDEFRRIRQLLTDLPTLPITLGLRPELVEGLDRSTRIADRTLLEQLAAALGERHLMSQSFVGMDPSAIVAVDLDDVYVDELRRGEDTLADAFPRSPTVRTVAIVDAPLTSPGADLLRDLGVRHLLLLDDAAELSGAPTTAATATSTTATAGTETAAPAGDASLASEIVLPGGGTLQAHTIDMDLASRIVEGVDDPALFANHTVAGLLLRQRELSAFGVGVDGRSFVVTTPDGTLPDASPLAALAALVDDDPRLRLAPLDVVLGRTDVRSESGDPVRIATASAPATDLSELASALAFADDEITTTGSMLPRRDERHQRWRNLLQIAPSDALTVEERAAYIDTTTNETAALRAAVVPPPETTFTLGGRSGDVTLSLRNDADVALRVIVRMSSPKLLFPEGPADVELAPSATTIVRIPVEARSNNTFPVTVEVLTPWQLAPVTPPVQLTARVTAYTGLGQVVTGAGALILATWWVRHWRTNRRRRLVTSGAVSGG
jgi:hypothetical protein